MTVEWFEQQGDGLCGRVYGKSVDVVRHEQANTWSVWFAKIRLKTDFSTKDEAKRWAENTDLIAYSIDMLTGGR